MSALNQIFRIMFATILILVAGTASVFLFVGVIEPFYQAMSGPPTSLGWGDPNSNTVRWGAISMLAVLVAVMLWFIIAPIRNDRRQEIRSP